MKTYKLLQFLFLAGFLFSCTSDDATLTNIENSFSIGAKEFDTSHAYLFYGNNPSYRDGFMIALTNAPIIQDNVHGAGVSNAMTQAVVLFVRISPNYYATEQEVIISNTTYTLDKNNATILTNVSGFTDTFVNSGLTYGQPNLSLANVHTIEASGNGTVTINSISINYFARTGTIDCTYHLMDDLGVVISGSYNGSFEIRNGS